MKYELTAIKEIPDQVDKYPLMVGIKYPLMVSLSNHGETE